MKTELRVALGDRLYGIERPWGALPATPGRVTDLAVGEDGLCLLYTSCRPRRFRARRVS